MTGDEVINYRDPGGESSRTQNTWSYYLTDCDPGDEQPDPWSRIEVCPSCWGMVQVIYRPEGLR